ncbi:MAG: hypothetical protein O2959_05435 [Proteobacteria bacterium]|nr:hypothetical protein [Pseudomonadota bacterium]
MIRFLIFIFISHISFANERIYSCLGMSHFELVGTSGAKEEKQNREYKFENLTLKDLNDIPCEEIEAHLMCKSTFLNVRTVDFNLQSLTIEDSISGNKGFGHYIENFTGACQIK